MIKEVFKVFIASILILSSCNDNEFGLGKHFVSPRVMKGIIDTVTVRVSTHVAADSVITSGRGIGFWGAYKDPYIGTIQTKSYIEFLRTQDIERERSARFDSITLILRPNGNYYGDTTKQLASLRVFKLAQEIERGSDGNLYSTDTVQVASLLADTTFKIRVKNIHNNEIEIKLPRTFGEELFQGIVRDDDDYKGNEFQKKFPGISIETSSIRDCIYGFFLNDTACKIRIYYHISTTSRQEKTMTFASNPYNCFYNMSNDKSELPDDFNTKSGQKPSSQTGFTGILTSGNTPIFSRLEFPYLNDLLSLGQIVKIERAILYVRPVYRSFDTIPLPARLNLFQFDPTSSSLIGDALSTGSNMPPQYGDLPADYHYIQRPEFPQYTFDISHFISTQLGRTGHEKRALSLLIPNEVIYNSGRERENTLQRLVFGDQHFLLPNGDERHSRDNRIKLEITYGVYND